MFRVLLVDDDRSMGELLQLRLGGRGIQVDWLMTGDEALALLASEAFDVVVTDLNMSGMNGLELCERIVSGFPGLPVIVITAHTSLANAVGALRVGAYDFITKPIDLDALVFALERAVTHKRLQGEVKRLERALSTSHRFDELMGSSPVMMKLFDLLGRVADLDTTVLISGETGTGKDLCARALHRRSRRSAGPYVAVNCAAMPEQLLESELFGHVKGAFTDAKIDHTGLFLQASGGTLFLDEIGELPMRLQPKLLRAIQERTVRPVGGKKEVPFDARIVAATNRDLEGSIEEGTFREDLYYRINVIHIEVPPLRCRGADVLAYAKYFIEHFATTSRKQVTGLTSATAEKLLAYSWPGNTRELQNCIERAVALTNYEELSPDDLPERIRNYKVSHVIVASEDPTELVSLEEVERRYMLRVLEACGGNKTLAAGILRVNRRTLARKLGTGDESPDDAEGAS